MVNREREKLSVSRKISLWWKFDGQYFWYNIKNGIKNLVKWFPIVWKDRDYDFQFIYDILEFKIQKQSEFMEKRDRFVSTKRTVEIMRLCVNLINKIKTDYYHLEYSDYHKSEFDFIPIEGSTNYTLESTELEENFQDYFDKYPLIYKKIINGNEGLFPNDSKLNIAINIGYYNQKRVKTLLYKILSNNLENWWD